MTDTAELLTASRNAHQQAKTALRDGNQARAQEQFRMALDARLKARDTDPKRSDPSWLDDALHPKMPGETARRYHRVAGLTVNEVAAQKDAELEGYYREQLGDVAKTVLVTDNPDVIVPKHWVLVKDGLPDLCPRGHRMQLLGFDQRVCGTCQRVEELREMMAVEDTLAHQQLQKEKARQ